MHDAKEHGVRELSRASIIIAPANKSVPNTPFPLSDIGVGAELGRGMNRSVGNFDRGRDKTKTD